MKQRIIPLMLATLLTTPLALASESTTLYGSFRAHYTLSKTDKQSRLSNMADSGSRLGLKGAEDLGNGHSIIFKLEWGFDTMEGGNYGDDFKKRHAYLGLEGDWGTLRLGHTTNPFKDTIATDTGPDQFNGLGRASTMGAVNYIFWGSLDSTGNSRRSNLVLYDSPNWQGLQFFAALQLDNDQTQFQHKNHIDMWTLNAHYQHQSGLYLRLGYMEGYTRGGSQLNPDDNRKSRAFGGQFGYESDSLALIFAYSDAKLKSANLHTANRETHFRDRAKGWDLGGRYSFGDNYRHNLYASIGQFKPKSATTSWQNQQFAEKSAMDQRARTWGIGYQYNLTARSRLWVEYEKVNYRHQESNLTPTHHTHQQKRWSNDTFSLGIRHDF